MGPGLHRRDVLRLAAATPLGIAGLTGLTGCGDSAWDVLPRTRLVLATGNRGGVFDRYGEALAAVLTDRLTGVTVRTVRTNASVENARLVAAGDADLGFSLADTAADAVRGTGAFAEPVRLTALARTYDSYVQLVVRAGTPLTDLRDLRGRRVGLGAPGSGTRVIAERILDVAGVDVAELEVDSGPLEQAADALAARDLDAFFFVSGIPSSAVSELATAVPIRLVELERWVPEMVSRYGPEYVSAPVPTSVYDLPRGIDTVSVKNYVLASPRLPEPVAYAVTRVMFEAQDAVDRRAPGVRQPSPAAAIFTSPVDLHPGARRWYREFPA
ncbi:MAG TPA: TAXI family TRAP transporter solute-binding subunit [Nocardioides sp.]|nr:TAXI family TRAP transporter solute-binding subunit [Nocardioides sp.]